MLCDSDAAVLHQRKYLFHLRKPYYYTCSQGSLEAPAISPANDYRNDVTPIAHTMHGYFCMGTFDLLKDYGTIAILQVSFDIVTIYFSKETPQWFAVFSLRKKARVWLSTH